VPTLDARSWPAHAAPPMMVSEPWWLFSKAISADACDRIVELGLSHVRERGIGRTDNLDDERQTWIAWIREDWVYKLVEPFIHAANVQAEWRFDVERMQSLQFGIYDVGGRYDWHRDMTGRPYSAKDPVSETFHGLLRKISYSLQLSEPTSYDGGDLELEAGVPGNTERAEKADPERARGTMIVFPAFIPHRITAVTRGVRYSLVGWLCGKPWR